MKQIIVIQEFAYNSLTELINIVSQASGAFVADEIKNNAYGVEKYDAYSCVNAERSGPKIYTNPVLNSLSYESYMLGKTKFYIEEEFEDGELVNAVVVDDIVAYDCIMQLSQHVYEEWVQQGSPKELYTTTDMCSYIHSLKYYNLQEGKDYYTITKNNEVIAIGFVPTYTIAANNYTKNLTKI